MGSRPPGVIHQGLLDFDIERSIKTSFPKDVTFTHSKKSGPKGPGLDCTPKGCDVRARPFSRGRISRKIPPGSALTPYFEVYTPVPLGVSRHFLKPQNMGSPPIHTVDAALRNGAWPRIQKP
jgi:hypothetical protein